MTNVFKTYLWKEIPSDNWWRIQTNDPAIIRKLDRRQTATRCVWGLNIRLVVFRTQYYSSNEAKKSLERITGQKIEKDGESGVFLANSGVILTHSEQSVTAL